MTISLSDRVNAINPSPTLAITNRANEMRKAGKNIIGLGAGEPDFDTPEHIKNAAIEAIHSGFTKYTAVDGIPALKTAIIEKLRTDNHLSYEPDQILVSCGGKQSFYNLTQAIINPGEQIIIPAPYWVSYPDMALLAGGEPVFLLANQDQNFKINPEQLRASLNDRSRLFVINSPSNPTGISYTENELKALARVLLEFPDLIIASDDMYEHIVWKANSFCNILNVCPELYDRTLVLNGVSKAYSMTGWRIGYAAGPRSIIQAMKKIQSHSTSNPTSISQIAAETALSNDQSCIDTMKRAFKDRHDFVVDALNKIKGISCLATDGTFYVFPDLQNVIATLEGIDDDVALSEFLIEKAGVAVVPGSAFGCPGHVRISIATSMENLVDACERIRRVLGV